MAVIATPESTWTEAEEHLWAIDDDRQSPSEKFGFFLAGVAKTTAGPRFTVQEFIPITDEDVEFHGRGAYEVDSRRDTGCDQQGKATGSRNHRSPHTPAHQEKRHILHFHG